MIITKKENVIVLNRETCIHYLVQFLKESKAVTMALIYSGSQVNAITLAYAKQLEI